MSINTRVIDAARKGDWIQIPELTIGPFKIRKIKRFETQFGPKHITNWIICLTDKDGLIEAKKRKWRNPNTLYHLFIQNGIPTHLGHVQARIHYGFFNLRKLDADDGSGSYYPKTISVLTEKEKNDLEESIKVEFKKFQSSSVTKKASQSESKRSDIKSIQKKC